MKFLKINRYLLLFALAVLLILTACTFGACAKQEDKLTVKLPPVAERDGYVQEYPTLNATVKRFPNKKGLSIYSRLFTPKDFDESKSYGIIIMSHGHDAVSADGNNSVVKNAIEQGMLAFSFDFCAASKFGKSEGEKETATNEDESDDLLCVADYVKNLKFVDKSRIVLFGQSRGGAVTTMTVNRCKDDVAALVLQAPAIFAYDNSNNLMRELKDYGKKICVLWGDADEALNVSDADKLLQFIGEDKMCLHIIEGAPHSLQPEDYRKALPLVNEYLMEMGVI